MNYYGAKELAESFRTVRKNTLVIAGDIPEDRYGFRPAKESRSVAESLVHIEISNRFQHKFLALERRTSFEGIDFAKVMKEFDAEEKRVRTKAELLELLRSSGEKFAGWLEGLSEEFFGEQVAMSAGQTPPSKSRFEMLLGVKEHEMHHRGQLMLVERIIGIVPHLTRDREARVSSGRDARPKS
jgi:uncharacterized damage-inducible protein DinB